MISPRQYAELNSVPYTTVMYWLRQGKIKEAVKRKMPDGGHYYEVPEQAPVPQLQPGRPKKTAGTGKKGGKK